MLDLTCFNRTVYFHYACSHVPKVQPAQSFHTRLSSIGRKLLHPGKAPGAAPTESCEPYGEYRVITSSLQMRDELTSQTFVRKTMISLAALMQQDGTLHYLQEAL